MIRRDDDDDDGHVLQRGSCNAVPATDEPFELAVVGHARCYYVSPKVYTSP